MKIAGKQWVLVHIVCLRETGSILYGELGIVVIENIYRGRCAGVVWVIIHIKVISCCGRGIAPQDVVVYVARSCTYTKRNVETASGDGGIGSGKGVILNPAVKD